MCLHATTHEIINNDLFMSKDYNKCLKGLLCLFVILHHISQKSLLFYDTNLGTLFQMMGYLSVAGFFYISGYGLMKSATRGDGGGTEYIRQFPRNRILSFYVDVIIIAAIYSFASIALHDTVDWLLIIKTLTYGDTIISNGWYFQVALLLYLMFYFSFIVTRTCSNSLLICTALVITFCIWCLIANIPQTIYESVLAFPLGMAIANDNKLSFIYKNKIITAVTAGLFVITVFGEHFFRGSILGTVIKMISSLSFIVVFLGMLWFINECGTKCNQIIVNPCFSWIGERSFEVYALQGLFLNAFVGIVTGYISLLLYAIIVFVFTMISAALVHIPIRKINGYIRLMKV